ncbi:MAG: hypothetical protein A2283_09515 [Lentisphaerae bacterium RIFOXYA12_FULL_48_11]|nr:MAG: hypothetical protein A2283_09515 [Lentisphaerae bacterium RIFOXYA12_FULL_48_11]
MKTLSILTITVLLSTSVIAAPKAAPSASPPAKPAVSSNLFEAADCVVPETKIDKLVGEKLSKLGIKPAICSDEVFLRRVYLDVTGTLPTAAEARDFLQDKGKNKRAVLVNRLLDTLEYADFWAMKWSDILRVKAEFPVNLWPNAAQAYHHWIKISLRDNKPYDKFVREMLVSNGSNFRVGPVNFYRAVQSKTPEGLAASAALAFMGTRVDTWKDKEALPGMSVFFSQVSYKPTREWKEEIVFWDPDKEYNDAVKAAEQAAAAAAAEQAAAIAAAKAASKTATNVSAKATTNAVPKQAANVVAQAATNAVAAKPAIIVPKVAIFPDGTKLKTLPPDQDPREIFADWLITPKNPWFTKSIVNRMWSWLMGRGIIHEPDDIRPDNPPSNPKLLAYLQEEFIASKYDMKHLFRLILNSRTYQSSSIVPKSKELAKIEANFGFYPLRRLDAEVLIDAINQFTGTSDLYTSAIPEPFTFIPENKPAVALPDGSISSSFLELFGKPARATGQENERVSKFMATQKMHLLNSGHIQRKLETSPKLRSLIKARTVKNKDTSKDILEEIYLSVLSRFPTADEVKNAHAYAKSGIVKGNDVWIDIVWALLNSDEFLYRH